MPLVVVGNAKAKNRHQFAIRVTFEGWSAGILPLAHDNTRLGENYEFTPAGVLAGALAVTEAFQFLRGNQPIAGRREVGLSLWCASRIPNSLAESKIKATLRGA